MKSAGRKLEIALQVLFLGLLVLMVLSQANPLFTIPSRDSGLFMYMGSQMLSGKLLYVDIWDNKGPLIFYLNALGLFLGHELRWGVWGMEFAFVLAAALFGFELMRRLWGIAPAVLASWFWLSGFNNLARGGNFTEDYSLAFNFAALYFYWAYVQKPQNRTYPFLIGVTMAFSFLLRANNIGVQLSIILVLILSVMFDRDFGKCMNSLLWIGFGGLAVLIPVSLYFLILGTFDEMLVAGYIYNFFYSSGGERLVDLSGSFLRGASLLGNISLIPALLGLIVLLERLFTTRRSEYGQPLLNLYLLVVIGWFVEIVMSGLSGKNFPHYYICWLPYIGFLGGFLVSTLVPVFVEHLNRNSLLTLILAGILVFISQPDTFAQYQTAFGRLLFDRGKGVEYNDPVAKYVRENSEPGDRVFAWGFQPYINLLAHRESPSGVLSYPLLIDSPYSGELNARFYEDLVQNKPVLIADMVNPDNDSIPFIDPVLRESQPRRTRYFVPPDNLDRVFEFIHENYHLETTIGDVMIYRLNHE